MNLRQRGGRDGRVVLWLGVALLALLAWARPARAAEEGVWPRRTAVVEAVEKASPSVVNIGTERIVTQRYDPFFQFRHRFFDNPSEEFFRSHRSRQYRVNSLGSGVIIDKRGYVITNEHVVARASKIHVTLSDGSNYEGELVSSDPDQDLAVIKINPDTDLPSAALGSSGDLMLGETVIAIGNPFGLKSSVSVGVVSATGRSIQSENREVMTDLIQADAAINPGNSGGALVNINGELIGINTAIYAQAQNIGFAVPVDKVRVVLGGLLDYRSIKRMMLGVDVQEVTEDLAARVGVEPHCGVIVAGVVDGSPAAGAGIEPLDIISELGGEPVRCLLDMRLTVLRYEPGDTIEVTVGRGEETLKKSLQIAEIPPPSGIELARKKFGLVARMLTKEDARKLRLRSANGMLVTGVEQGSPAHKAGVGQGDVIIQFAGQPASDARVGLALEKVEPGEAVYFLLLRKGGRYRGVMQAR